MPVHNTFSYTQTKLHSTKQGEDRSNFKKKKKKFWLYAHVEVNFQKSPQNIIISTVNEERILTLETQYAFSGLIQ